MAWRIAIVLAVLLAPAPGCYLEVTGSESGELPAAHELASTLEVLFAAKAGGATASIRCPAGLTGDEGNRLRCAGETSDGFTLDIAVLERGAGGFRWDVVESHAIR